MKGLYWFWYIYMVMMQLYWFGYCYYWFGYCYYWFRYSYTGSSTVGHWCAGWGMVNKFAYSNLVPMMIG